MTLRTTLTIEALDSLDEIALRDHLDGPKFKHVLQNLQAELRNQIKYGDPPCGLEVFSAFFHEALAESRLSLDDG